MKMDLVVVVPYPGNATIAIARRMAEFKVLEAMLAEQCEPAPPDTYVLRNIVLEPQPASGLQKRPKLKGRGRHKKKRWR